MTAIQTARDYVAGRQVSMPSPKAIIADLLAHIDSCALTQPKAGDNVEFLNFTPADRAAEVRQSRVRAWVVTCFGEAILKNIDERMFRVLEETIELAQALNIPFAMIGRIAQYVYMRPVGDPVQEFGGVRVTLLALAATLGINAWDAELAEIDRITAADPDKFRRRNSEKEKAGVGLYSMGCDVAADGVTCRDAFGHDVGQLRTERDDPQIGPLFEVSLPERRREPTLRMVFDEPDGE